jgi:hypothetical protein
MPEIKAAYNKSIRQQMELLLEIVTNNPIVNDVLIEVSGWGLKDYYIGAGCINQSVWNYQSGFPLEHGIKDIDLVYYDKEDLSNDGEKRYHDKLQQAFPLMNIKIDVKNQASVHLWYEDHFGYAIKPYESLEQAINTWPTTATAVGIQMNKGQCDIYAPFGLNDLFGRIVRANKAQITREIYEKKTSKWLQIWPDLIVIPWDEPLSR